MDEMTNKFTVIAPQNFQEFSQIFQGDTSADLYQGCDGLCENSRGFSTTVFLLPGELEFLHEVGVHPEHLLDPISTATGSCTVGPAATCTYTQNDRCLLGKEPYIKPVECAIYPLIFKRNGSGEFSLCPICRHRQAFLDSGFIDKAKVMMTVYLLPYLDNKWLRYRNELNFTINEDCYHRLKRGKAGQPMTIKEFKQCALDNCH